MQSLLHMVYSNKYLKQKICQQTPFLMLTSFLLTSPDWQLIVEPIHLFIKTVIIRLFLANQIFKLFILYPIRNVSWISKNSILILDSVQKAIKIVEWYFMFMNKTLHEQVITFNTILMNIFWNYILNNYIIIDDKDIPWRTKSIKDKIHSKKSLCKSKYFISLQDLSLGISEMICIRKVEYYDHLSKKFNNPNSSAKTYWTILKSFYIDTMVPLMPPLLLY